jgi:hypothetical protein
MSVLGVEAQFQFRPFYAILEDDLDRMFEFVKSEEFQFFVNGKALESTLEEAVLISPRVHEALRHNRNNRTFTISDDTINSKLFGIFLELVRSHDCVALLKNKKLSLLSICRLFGNERRVLILLASINSSLESDSRSPSTTSFKSSGEGLNNHGLRANLFKPELGELSNCRDELQLVSDADPFLEERSYVQVE